MYSKEKCSCVLGNPVVTCDYYIFLPTSLPSDFYYNNVFSQQLRAGNVTNASETIVSKFYGPGQKACSVKCWYLETCQLELIYGIVLPDIPEKVSFFLSAIEGFITYKKLC